jgi:ethanolamine utilization microcompartment shell protein EutL
MKGTARMEGRMIHRNWSELIKPQQLDVRPGNDPQRQATLIAEPLERGLRPDARQRAARVLLSSLQGGPSSRSRSTACCTSSRRSRASART